MAQFRTASHLQAALDSESGWRTSEISNLRSAIANAEGLRKKVLLRSSVPISYAHWEGFVKRAAHFYGVYLSSAVSTYGELKPCFAGLAAMNMVQTLGDVRRKIATAARLTGQIQNLPAKPVVIKLWPVLEDIGNLDYGLFEEILLFFDFNAAKYASKKPFIDESLVRTRNSIAHGERLDVGQEAVAETFSQVIALIRAFKADIENAVTSQTYLR